MKKVEPKVFLIAESIPSWHGDIGLQAYLRHIGAKGWATDSSSGGETIIEVMARSCYRSFGTELNPNITKVRKENKAYLANILRVGHGSVLEHSSLSFMFCDVSRVFCYSSDTEVLTDEGWKRWPDVTGIELFATLNQKGELEFRPSIEMCVEPYTGLMYHVVSEQIDLMTTPNHRVWASKFDTRTDKVFRIRSVESVMHKRVKYQKGAGCWGGEWSPEFISIPDTCRGNRRYDGPKFPIREFLRFLGLFISEGHTNSHDTGIALTQNEGYLLDYFKSVLASLDIKFNEQPSGAHISRRLQFKNVALYDWLRQNCGTRSYNKRVPRKLLLLPKELLEILLSSLVLGDGNIHKSSKHIVYYTSSKGLSDDLQEIALRVGLAANIRVDDRVGEKHVVYTGAEVEQKRVGYVVSFLKPSRLKPLVNHNRNSRSRFRHSNGFNDALVNYSGYVYCARVDQDPGLLYVRRNGKPCWSGNTHELVRHRAGTAISQESLRFVRLTQLGQWLPSIVKENEGAVRIMERMFNILEQGYRSLVDQLDLEKDGIDFKYKKTATSAIRRIAPIGMATNIGWTANFRTLRHVIEMRTDEQAEEEIRLVFSKVAEICMERYPAVFGDYERVEVVGSSIPKYVTKNRKV